MEGALHTGSTVIMLKLEIIKYHYMVRLPSLLSFRLRRH